ncbi:hypothetical protein BHE74_00023069 [Ensete ventricosum]|nr:hypothetical protein GW17_00041686 [Ensete ventricosum]RWW69338.1 hypothetical protein BHE74_00023069 [Ensete ventricosum]RZS09158.1 hypothetical protein BHM03_00040216 [Ensete ventricosum]
MRVTTTWFRGHFVEHRKCTPPGRRIRDIDLNVCTSRCLGFRGISSNTCVQVPFRSCRYLVERATPRQRQ